MSTHDDLVMMLTKATKHIMEKTGDPFDVAVKKAKIGVKEYIRLRVDAMKDLVAEGYSEEYALRRSAELVNFAIAISR